MIGRLASRLRAMSREELAWRLRTTCRTQAQGLRASVHAPRWRRADLRHRLADAAVTPALDAALRSGRWSTAQALLANTLRAQPPRYVIDATVREALRDAVLGRWPDAAAEASARADRVMDGVFDLLGYRDLRFTNDTGVIDWHLDPVHGCRMPSAFWSRVPYLDPRCGDHKVVWEINRQQHWLTLGRAAWLTGDPRYARAIVADLESWLAANPPLMGANWASMLELAFRSLSWLFGLQVLLGMPEREAGDEPPWLVDLLVAFDQQLSHVADNLSWYFSPNTHLTGEALALYVCGHALPILKRSPDWIAVGRRALLRELDRQVCADGGHAERSTHYHRYTLDFYQLALMTARAAGDREAEARFRDAVLRLALFARAMADDRGRLPRIGDDDGGMLWPLTGRDPADVRDTLAVAASLLDRPDLLVGEVPEEALWLTAADAAAYARAARIRAQAPVDRMVVRGFPNTGYVTLRDARRHLIFDGGPHGYLNAGHAHTDPLAITMSIGGVPFLIDPGTATYTVDPELRDHMRSSMSHNTITVDGVTPALPAGPFHWRSMAHATLQAQCGNGAMGWIDGFHDGYSGIQHRRMLFAGATTGTLIVDRLSGAGRHEARAHWHFDPAWTVSCRSDDCLHASRETGEHAWLLHDGGAVLLVRGDEDSRLGWCAPTYGSRVTTWTACVSRSGELPITMMTWAGDGTPDATPSMTRVPVDADVPGGAIAVRVALPEREWITMVRIDEPDVRRSRRCTVGTCLTDARAFQYEVADGRLVSFGAADVTRVELPQLAVICEQPMTDLALRLHDRRVDLWSSNPMARIRLQGADLTAIDDIRLNGRAGRPVRVERRDVLIVTAADWAGEGTQVCAA